MVKSALRVWLSVAFLCLLTGYSNGQTTFPVNGIAEPKSGSYVLFNAIIMQDPSTKIEGGSIHIKNGRIIAVGKTIAVPADAVKIDCRGKYIYPSFIDAYSDYGIATPQKLPTDRLHLLKKQRYENVHL